MMGAGLFIAVCRIYFPHREYILKLGTTWLHSDRKVVLRVIWGFDGLVGKEVYAGEIQAGWMMGWRADLSRLDAEVDGAGSNLV